MFLDNVFKIGGSFMTLKKILVSFFALMMMFIPFSTNVVNANNDNEDTVRTIYTTTDYDAESLGKEIGGLLAEPGVDRVRVIYTDLLHNSRNQFKNESLLSTNGWTVTFSCPYPPYEIGDLPIARNTGRPGGLIKMNQTKSVAVDVSGNFSIGLDELGVEFGTSVTESITFELGYEQTVPLNCTSMTVEAYTEYEVHHFVSYYNGSKDGSGTIKYPIGIVYDEIINYD